MEDYENEMELFAVSNHSKQYDYLKDQTLELVKKFNLNNKQLAKLLNLSVSEIGNLMNDSDIITNEKSEEIDNKLTMLNFGFENFDVKERVKLILNDLLTDYMLTTEKLSKIIYVEEKDLIDFRKKTLLDREIELKICVNIIFLHFILHK
ncbi:HTH domain-containing protein [Lysinibacillus sp. NPDC097214]|uniref:HTH domain-containing protein n=1 Tax=Lysinibacillus sp. NPDC097214 TaxID=3390584 RepID=UPI003CFCB4BF